MKIAVPIRPVPSVLIVLLLLTLQVSCSSPEPVQPISETVAQSLSDIVVDARTGVKISFDHSVETMPEHWRDAEVAARSYPLDIGEIARSERLVKEAIALYPAQILANNLDTVYIVSNIEFYGMGYGATYYEDSIYLANAGSARGFTDEFLRASFHHELSSILLENFPNNLNRAEWSKGNVKDFRYMSSGIAALSGGQSDLRYDRKYHKLGFLNQYGMSSLEEDFNTYAEALFSGENEFWEIVDTYPLVKTKTRTMISFYHSLDSQLTEQYFRKIKP